MTNGGTIYPWDAFVVKLSGFTSLNLLCSPGWKVDGNDPICRGGLFKNKVWAYLWPAENIKQVEFYLDGKFRRTERYAPWELDGGKASWLGTGPHEVRR